MPRVEKFIVDAVNNANDKLHEASADILRLWKSDIVFTWHWWVGAALSVLPWIFWVIARKKESTNRLLFGGFAVLIVSSFLDHIGMTMRLWDYPTKVLPLIPPFLPWDFTLLPVVSMLFYQWKPGWNPWLKGAVFSAIGAFLVQPVFRWMAFYETHLWKDWYSFPILIGIYMIGYFFVMRGRFEKL